MRTIKYEIEKLYKIYDNIRKNANKIEKPRIFAKTLAFYLKDYKDSCIIIIV